MGQMPRVPQAILLPIIDRAMAAVAFARELP